MAPIMAKDGKILARQSGIVLATDCVLPLSFDGPYTMLRT